MMRRRLVTWAAILGVFLSASLDAGAESIWKAGVAKAVITPKEPMWMAGYGSRDKPSQGQEMDLFLRVVALEDADGHRAVILSSDTLGIPRTIYDAVAERLE